MSREGDAQLFGLFCVSESLQQLALFTGGSAYRMEFEARKAEAAGGGNPESRQVERTCIYIWGLCLGIGRCRV